MNSKTTTLLLAGVLLCFAWESRAQDTLRIDFDEAVQRALQRNVDYRTQQNEVGRAQATATQSLFGLGPEVSISGDFFERKGRQQVTDPDDQSVRFVDVTSRNISLGLNASMVLFNGLNRIFTYRSSSNALRAQELGLESAKQQAIVTVTQQYMQALLSKELYLIALDNYRDQEESLKRIEGQVEVNARPMVDLYNQKAEVSRFKSLLIAAENTYKNDLATLAQSIQLEPSTPFVLDVPASELDALLAAEYDLESLYQTAMANRPDVRQQAFATKASSQSLWATKGGGLPTVSAFYNYGTFYNSTIPSSISMQLREVFPAHFYGLTVNVPIFSKFQNTATIQRAKVDYENAKLQDEAVKFTVYQEVLSAYNNVIASKASYYAAKDRLESASLALQLQKERYDIGAGSFVDYSQAVNSHLQAKAGLSQAIFSLKFQQIILDYQCGIIR